LYEKIKVVRNTLVFTTEEGNNHPILSSFIVSSLRHALTEI